MIDTIVIKLHHVSKYPLTQTKFEADSIKGETTVLVDTDSGLLETNDKVRAIMYHDSDSIIPLTKRSNYLIPSSHYLLSYFYKVQDDCVEFNFSIPKYLYATNIFQFIPYFDQSSEACFKLFREFIRDFTVSFFPDKIDLRDIEINRIDMCYNQFFLSKTDAKRYLASQMEILIKYARSSKNKYKTHADNGLTYVTGRYSFKIYHKGDEFRDKDMVELQKRNPKKYNIGELAEIADRVLRYEITFRKSQLDYLFKQNKLHNDYFPFDIDNEESLQGFVKGSNGEQVVMLDKRTGQKTVLNIDRYRDCLDYSKRGKTYFIDCDPWDAIINMTAEFSYPLFKLLFDFFWAYVDKFQLETKKSIKDIQDNIDKMHKDVELKNKFNRKQDHKKDKTRLTMIAMLAQVYPMETLKSMQIIPLSTYYKYVKELKQIGVLTEDRLPESVPKPDLGYLDYKYYFGPYHLK